MHWRLLNACRWLNNITHTHTSANPYWIVICCMKEQLICFLFIRFTNLSKTWLIYIVIQIFVHINKKYMLREWRNNLLTYLPSNLGTFAQPGKNCISTPGRAPNKKACLSVLTKLMFVLFPKRKCLESHMTLNTQQNPTELVLIFRWNNGDKEVSVYKGTKSYPTKPTTNGWN